MKENLKLIERREVLGKEFKIYGDLENPLFLAKDVANWIDYRESNACRLLNTVGDEEKSLITIVRADGRTNKNWFLTEDGLYEVLMQSSKPIAKAFKKEVKEILKTKRKTGEYKRPKSTRELLELELQLIKEVEEKVDDVKKDLNEFKSDIPLFAIEVEEISNCVIALVVSLLGGKESNAYRDKSLRGKVYSDIYRRLRGEFGVHNTAAIKRKNFKRALDIIKSYELPLNLYELIEEYFNVNCA